MKLTFRQMIDMPPVWLAGFIAIAWVQVRWFSLNASLSHPLVQFLAGLLIGGGLVVIGMAVLGLRRQQTTIIPHQVPQKLVTNGIYKRSRNPIYLGDFLILAGAILWMDAVLSLVLLPLFVWVMTKRFIIPEENRLRRQFRVEFAKYLQKTPRWL